ncbi:MAG: dienelactone hydrolase family protein [Acidimicrobiales bacterium]
MSTTAPTEALRWTGEDGLHRGVRRRGFAIERDGRSVPGLLWTPPDAVAPTPLVLVGHGGSGHKGQDHVRTLARRMVLRHGMAAAAIDGPVHGDRRTEPEAPAGLVLLEFAQVWSTDGEAMTDAIVADWRTTLDALQRLPELGAAPVGWWGLSLGTILGLPLVAAEDRVAAAVLGLMGCTGPTSDRIERDAAAVRCPVLFLLQWDDTLFSRHDALALFGALGGTDKRLHAHPGGHGEVPVEEHEASADFLAARLRDTPSR